MKEIQILNDTTQDLINIGGKTNNQIRNILDKAHNDLLMIVERRFGKERNYTKRLEELKNMGIGPFVVTTTMPTSYIDNKVREDLFKKRDRYLNLIETILAELGIERVEELKEEVERIEREIQEEKVEERLIRILSRFHRFTKQLKRRQGRSTIPIIEVQNEYDVQDLLHALLKLEFDDVRAEEYTPSYAGSNSRIDFLLKKEEIVVEVKKSSEKLKDKEIGVQLNDDIAKYKTHPNCKVLYCFIYDPQELLSNPDGLENDLSKDTEEFKVKVIIIPKR